MECRYQGTCWFYTGFWHDISQLILWIDLHKGHRYELKPLIPLKPFEQKWWKLCDLESVEFYRRFWDDICQLILWIFLHEGDWYGFRPAIPAQASEQKWLRQFESFLWNCWGMRFWHDISQLILWIYLCKGHKYELWLAIPVQYNPLTDIKKKQNLIYQRKVSGGRMLLSKHVKS